MTPLFRKFLSINWVLFANMLALLAFGVYAIYNASAYREEMDLATKWHQQLRWVLIGLPVFFGAALIDYKWVRWGAWPMYIAGIGGLVLVAMFGVEKQGNKNWLEIGNFSMQPSQFAILAGILALAVVFGDLQRWIPAFRYPALRMLVAGIMAAIPVAMVAKEDEGSALVWGPVFIAMMVVGSIPFRYLLTLVLIVACIVPFGYFFALKSYQQERIDTWIYFLTDQVEKVDKQKAGWVPDKLLIAVGSAGFEGKGPESRKVAEQRTVHRTFFPDESINDYIFAVIAEEFGFRGGLMLLAGMLLLMLMSVFVAFNSRDQLGRLIVVGGIAMLFIHTFENAGMNILLTPTTGIPMPFISYGGTFVVVCMFVMGMIQSVWIHRNISPVTKKSGGQEELAEE